MDIRVENSGLARPLVLMEALLPLQGELKRVEEQLPKLLSPNSQTGNQVLQHVISAGGKRLRPALFLLCSDLVGYDGKWRQMMACVGEYVHLASLLHDDVVDQSERRRNRVASHVKWGNDRAILTGDLVYSTACELLCKTGNTAIVSSYARSIRLMSDGELMQLDELYNADLTEEKYFQILESKTAVLLGTICKAAGYLSQLDEDKIGALYQLGLAIGISYQVIDDCLDYLPESESLGKPVLSDLPDGKLTLPLILLRQKVEPQEWLLISQAIRSKNLSHEVMLQIREKLEAHGVLQECFEVAHTHAKSAIEAISVFNDSASKSRLVGLVESLLLRRH